MSIKHILVPTDGSECGNAAAGYACDLATSLGARVTLLRSFEPPTVALPDAVYAATDAELKMIADANSEQLQELATSLGRPGLTLDYEVVEGHAADVILDAAAHDGVDLVVMGTHGRRGVSRLLLGSVAASVVRAARCPVLTIRPHETAHAAV